jgi:glycerophosphoryl diester phosphodiesterase
VTSPRTGRPYLDAVLDQPGSVLAMAHRGGSPPEIAGLENTLAAFEHAVSLGYDYLETDAQVTSDGVLMAFHDDELDRLTDQSGSIWRLPYAHVREVRVAGREEIPRLEDLFDALPRPRFNIDLKSVGSPRALADFITARGAWDRVLVGSFSTPRMREFRRLVRGRVATSATPAEVGAVLAAPGLAAVRRATAGCDALQIPHFRHGLRVTSPRLVRRAHAVGKHVHVWTIDTPDEIRQLVDRGADGLFTDRTDVLKAVLVEDGRWRETTT